MAEDDYKPGLPDDDRTVLRPRPGAVPGGRSEGPPPGTPTPVSQPSPPTGVEPPQGVGINPLVGAAMPLLLAAVEIRRTAAHPDPEGLRNRMVQEVRRFEQRAAEAGLRSEVILSARYVLCAFVDEAVLTTPWGSHSGWSRQGLLITYHKEAWGGEKFFLLLERLLARPGANRELLDLMYVILSLGFEGRYGPMPEGPAALDRLRHQVYITLRDLRGEPEPELSPHWKGVERPQRTLSRATAVWVSAATSIAALAVLYFVLAILVNQASDPVLDRFEQLNARLATLVPEQPAPAEPAPRVEPTPSRRLTLRDLLSDQIAAGKLDVAETPERGRIILFGDGMFPSGSARIRPQYLPVLERVAQALQRIPGRVLVTGHTDDRPIRTLRFPSNWHLSQARAEAAARFLIGQTGQNDRFYAEGRAHTEPLVPNDTPAHRARNRRVEITLYYAGAASRTDGKTEGGTRP